MSKYIRYTTILGLISLVFFSCSFDRFNRNFDNAMTYQFNLWLQENTAITDSILVPSIIQTQHIERPIVRIPNSANTYTLLGVIEKERPDYVLVIKSQVWDGVKQQTWFQQRYKPLVTFDEPYDTYTPATVFVYQPTPFDVGQSMSVTQNFLDGAPTVTSLRVSSPRIFPERPFYLSMTWAVTTLATMDDIFLSIQLDPLHGPSPINLVQEEFKPVYETFFDATFIKTYHILLPPVDLAFGSYAISISLNQENLAPYPVSSVTDSAGNNLRLTTVTYPASVSPSDMIPMHPVTYTFMENNQPVIALTGYDMITQTLRSEELYTSLIWHSLEEISGDYTVFVHLRDSENNVVSQADAKPVAWNYPTPNWMPGEYVYDEHILDISEGIPRGIYRVVVGLYDAKSGNRVPILDGAHANLPDNEIPLSVILVR